MGTKSEVKKACRSVPSQWYHSGDATSNRERERTKVREEREKERKRKRERKRERESAHRLQKEGRHMWGPKAR